MKENRIIGIYLAAGQSKRMGRHKLSLPLGDGFLGSMALKTILQTEVNYTAIITNPLDDLIWVSPALRENGQCGVFPCHDYMNGQSSSLKLGIKIASKLQADAAVIFLADQPFISIKMISKLISLYKGNEHIDVVSSCFNGIWRPPTLFSQKLFSQLLNIQGDKGAREILKEKKEKNRLAVEFQSSMLFLDVDNEEDYLLARNLVEQLY
ncbi:nucleotidyltransferase family protein [Heyndrickxia ginsengihumi]|uniref:nucleotidyltransferase family protein n=1 Tax=Heyndrickxia ginsengihumi TaxID=363870 RepID=UPI00046E6CB4|nr:nucleotidyltransferase family protein [Heyndrickxia ginsengihumi]